MHHLCLVDAKVPGESRQADQTRGQSLPTSGRRRRTVTTFEFSIIASGLDPEAEGFADRFFEAGCDDATISVQKGHIILDFAREALSVEDAICSAVDDA